MECSSFSATRSFATPPLRSSANHREDGYTILEILVALAILSVALVTLYAAMGDSAHRIALARSESLALDVAETKLDEVGKTAAPTIGETAGMTGGFAWQVSISAFGTADDRTAWPATLLSVDVRVTWPNGGRRKSVRLHTLKIVSKG